MIGQVDLSVGERDHLPRDRLQKVGPVQRKKLKARQACRVKMLEEDPVASNSIGELKLSHHELLQVPRI